jgi:hypothetical protein
MRPIILRKHVAFVSNGARERQFKTRAQSITGPKPYNFVGTRLFTDAERTNRCAMPLKRPREMRSLETNPNGADWLAVSAV